MMVPVAEGLVSQMVSSIDRICSLSLVRSSSCAVSALMISSWASGEIAPKLSIKRGISAISLPKADFAPRSMMEAMQVCLLIFW